MLYYIITIFTLFGISYFFLPRAMWHHYFTDTSRNVALAVVFFLIVTIWTVVSKQIPWGFVFGFWLFDPWSYRMIVWPNIKARLDLIKRIEKQCAEADRELSFTHAANEDKRPLQVRSNDELRH